MNLRSRIRSAEKLAIVKIGRPLDDIKLRNEFSKWTTEELKHIAFCSGNEEIPKYLQARLNEIGIVLNG